MEPLLSFVQDRWLLLVGAIIALWLIIKLVRTAMKWILVIAIVGGILYYSVQYMEQIETFGKQVISDLKQEAIQQMIGEASNAAYHDHGNGGYSITTANFKLEGQQGKDEVTVTFKGQSFTFRMNDLVLSFIESVKQNSKQ